MSGVGRVFPGARVRAEWGQSAWIWCEKAAASWLTCVPPNPPVSSSPGPAPRIPGTHLSAFTALSFFFGLKNEGVGGRKIKDPQASHSLAPDPCLLSGSILRHLVPTK